MTWRVNGDLGFRVSGTGLRFRVCRASGLGCVGLRA